MANQLNMLKIVLRPRPLARITLLLLTALLAIAACTRSESVDTHETVEKQPSQHEVKIGVLLSQTGPIAPYGKKALEGVMVAQEKLRAQGVPVTFVIEDAASTPKTALSAYEKLVTVDKVPLVIGPESSGLAMALAPVANQRKIVLFAPTVATDAFSSKGDYTFRNWPSSTAIAFEMADVASQRLKLTNIALVHINNEMGKSYQGAFKTRFEERGGTVSVTEAYPPDTTDFRQVLSNVKRSKAQAIYLVGQVEMGHALRQMHELQINVPVLSGVAIEDPKVKDIAGSLTEGIIYTTPGFDPSSQIAAAKEFEDAFHAKFARPADIFAASSYDAAMIVGQLVRNGRRSSENLKEGLFGIKDFSGATGSITLDENGDVRKKISVKKIINGIPVFLDDQLQPLSQ